LGLYIHGETFRVLKEKEEKQYGEYRTRRCILGALGNSLGVRLGILEFSIIHKKVSPALKRSAKGIKNYIKIEAQSSRLC
jgi:hypothetical protein